jgi:ribokinase
VNIVGKIAVIGSMNMDYTIETDTLPNIGETVLANHFFKNIGGKGANQAVAAARLGGEVSLYGSLGLDENGQLIKEQMEKENINVSNLHYVKESPTGVAFIELFNSDNRILVVPGANQYTNISYIKMVEESLLKHNVFVFQLETPIEILEYLIPILYQSGKIIIVNPAPAKTLKKELIEKITYLIPNEHEYNVVLDENELKLKDLLQKYANKLIVTLGKKGAAYHDGNRLITIPILKVEAVDATGAGDTFTGAFSVAIAKGKSIRESIRFANIAAGLSVTKKGAQTGMPFETEVVEYFGTRREVPGP